MFNSIFITVGFNQREFVQLNFWGFSPILLLVEKVTDQRSFSVVDLLHNGTTEVPAFSVIPIENL